MLKHVLGYSIRIIYSLSIVVSGSLWLLAFEGYVGGWWLGSPQLRQVSLLALFTLAMMHFILGIFPMHWGYRALDRLIQRYFPSQPIRFSEKE